MAEILPSINCPYKDLDAVAVRCAQVAKIFKDAGVPDQERWAHFDVADGAFTLHKSWNDPGMLKQLQIPFVFEAHLMVEDPRAAMEHWIAGGARRIVVHLETAPPEFFKQMVAMAQVAKVEIALAINPETPVEAMRLYFRYVSRFLILAVHPGLSGQKFLPTVLSKVSFLRREVPNAKIEVDGGIDEETARAAIDAGADALVSGSYIFDAPDPEVDYKKLRVL